MAKRTQIVCMHEGKTESSIDPVFANAFLKAYDPEWLRPIATGKVRFIACGGKTELQKKFPQELKNCIAAGSDITLIVLADIDNEIKEGEQLKEHYWRTANENDIPRQMFDKVVFICPKDRIENWIQYLATGTTDENMEGPRIKKSKRSEGNGPASCKKMPPAGDIQRCITPFS